MKKKCQVIMLDADFSDKNFGLLKGTSGNLYPPQAYTDSFIPQHLYILSNDEIKDGDWIYHNNDDKPIKYNGKWSESELNPTEYGYKKVIATTDMLIKDNFSLPKILKDNFLPKISIEFIKQYCERGDIKEVDVEYEYKYPLQCGIFNYSKEPSLEVKIVNNNVCISKN